MCVAKSDGGEHGSFGFVGGNAGNVSSAALRFPFRYRLTVKAFGNVVGGALNNDLEHTLEHWMEDMQSASFEMSVCVDEGRGGTV